MSVKSNINLSIPPSVKSAMTVAIRRENEPLARLAAIRRILSKVMPPEQAKHIAKRYI